MGAFSLTPETISDVSVAQILELFREDGFSAEQAALPSGKPYVRFKVEGFTSTLHFYSEVEGKPGHYRSIQFAAAFRDQVSLEKANSWNRERRFIKVYADADGELQFDQDVNLDGGVTKQFLLARIRDWRSMFSPVLSFLAR